MIRIFSIAILLFSMGPLLCSCQTSPAKDFSRLQPGMEKIDVLDIMGGPQRKRRSMGVDKWTYIYYDQKTKTEKEIHFEDGKAIYLGEVLKPEISADEQDLRNEASNREVARRYQEHRSETISNLPRIEEPTSGGLDSSEPSIPQFQQLK